MNIDRSDALFYRVLERLAGYLGDSSQTTIVIDQDDATRDWILKVGRVTYYGSSLKNCIRQAATTEGILPPELTQRTREEMSSKDESSEKEMG